jgi:hypothetical protein
VNTGVAPSLNPDQETTVSLPIQWQAGNHTIKFQADPASAITEASEENNTIEQRTNALAVGFWVEQGFYKWFNDNQNQLGIGSNSFEDWAQRQLREWHKVFEASKYSSNPNGIVERTFLDKVVIVPDGSIVSKEKPAENDKTIDLEWGFRTAEFINKGFYDNNGQPKTNLETGTNPFYLESSLWHELSHARYLVDTYAVDINNDPSLGTDQSKVLKKDGTPLIPKATPQYSTCEGGMMGCRPPAGENRELIYGEMDVFAFNDIAGKRALCGNYNAPCNIGSFLTNLPHDNRIKILDLNHQPIASAQISVYQSVPIASNVVYDKLIDNTPDITCSTDATGTCSIGSDPFNITPTDPNKKSREMEQGVAILKITKNNQEDFRFLYIPELVVAYYKHQEPGVFTFDNINLTGTEQITPTPTPPTYCLGSCPTPTPTETTPIPTNTTPSPSTNPTTTPCTTSASTIQVTASKKASKHQRKNTNQQKNNGLLNQLLDLLKLFLQLIGQLLGNTPNNPTLTPTPTPQEGTPTPEPTILPPCDTPTPTTEQIVSPTPQLSDIQNTPTTSPLTPTTPLSSTPTAAPTTEILSPTAILSISPTATISPSLQPSEEPTPTVFTNPTEEPPTQTLSQIPTPTTTPTNNLAAELLKTILEFLSKLLDFFLSLVKR